MELYTLLCSITNTCHTVFENVSLKNYEHFFTGLFINYVNTVPKFTT